MKPLRTADVVALRAFTPVAEHADGKCHRPEGDDTTRWGGNQAIVLTPAEHFREVRGIVELFAKELVENELIEVFDKPEYLVSDKPWGEKPQQNRLRACATCADGKFCFKKLPDGVYEVRVSQDQGWNVTHSAVDGKAGTNEPLHMGMRLGT